MQYEMETLRENQIFESVKLRKNKTASKNRWVDHETRTHLVSIKHRFYYEKNRGLRMHAKEKS